jgi:hypothetical protein
LAQSSRRAFHDQLTTVEAQSGTSKFPAIAHHDLSLSIPKHELDRRGLISDRCPITNHPGYDLEVQIHRVAHHEIKRNDGPISRSLTSTVRPKINSRLRQWIRRGTFQLNLACRRFSSETCVKHLHAISPDPSHSLGCAIPCMWRTNHTTFLGPQSMLNESAVRSNYGQFVPIMDNNPGNRARVEDDGSWPLQGGVQGGSRCRRLPCLFNLLFRPTAWAVIPMRIEGVGSSPPDGLFMEKWDREGTLAILGRIMIRWAIMPDFNFGLTAVVVSLKGGWLLLRRLPQ